MLPEDRVFIHPLGAHLRFNAYAPTRRRPPASKLGLKNETHQLRPAAGHATRGATKAQSVEKAEHTFRIYRTHIPRGTFCKELQHFKNSIDRFLTFAHGAIIRDVDRIAELLPLNVPGKRGPYKKR